MPTKPLLKWVGGKTQILPFLLDVFPMKIRTYYEPFMGGGSVFFRLAQEGRFERATISDANPHLMNVYRAARDFPAAVAKELASMADRYEDAPASCFESWRSMYGSPSELFASPVIQAALFIGLNKTCFNGVFRVNKQGRFNVPWGKKLTANLPSQRTLTEAGDALNRHVRILTGDYMKATVDAGPGDLVYLDPPYVPISATSSFTSYTVDGFGLEEHRRVAEHFTRLADQGATVVLSNNDTPLVRELYGDFEILPLPVKRTMGASAASRGSVQEVVITSRQLVRIPLPVLV